MKNDVLIIGSGLAAITASRLLIENGHKVSLMSSNYKNDGFCKKNNLPSARINNEFSKINDDFIKKYQIKTNNFSVIGSNALGGLSNIWGGGFMVSNDYLKSQNKKNYYDKISDYFKIVNLNLQKNEFRNYLIPFSNNEVSFTVPNFFKSKKNNLNYSSKDDLTELKKNKNFSFFPNCFVTKINKNKNKTFDIYIDNNSNKSFNFKKIVLALGTIGSTKILLDYFDLYNHKIRIKHNPQIAILGFLKKKIINSKKKIDGDVFFKVEHKEAYLSSVGLLGTISDDIVDIICKKFFFVPSYFIKLFFKIFKNRIFVGNCFLPNSFSESYLSLKKETLKIEGNYRSDYYNFEKKTIKKIRQNFCNFSFFSLFCRMPIGSDIHYTGTIDYNNHYFFKLNKNYSLKSDKNIYIIDGSVLQGNPIYPGLYIINNAIDFSCKFSKP